MVRMITEDEMERSKQEKTSEQLKLKKQITDIVENLKEKLNKAIQELKTMKDENTKLQEELDATKAALEQEKAKAPAPKDGPPAAETDPGILETLKGEIQDLKALITERDKKIELDKEILDKTTAYKEELEQRISDLTGELHQMSDTMKKPQAGPTPVFAPVEEAAPAQPESRGRLLGGKPEGSGSILGAKQQDEKAQTVETVKGAEAAPEPQEEAPIPAEVAEVPETIPIPEDIGEQAICPVCGGEGVIGVRKKDGSIVQEVCPNCRGAGKV